MSKTIGLINPGAMGASVGAAAATTGNQVIWASAGRSEVTRERAERVGLMDCGTLQRLVEQSDIILSVCPPHAAAEIFERLSQFKDRTEVPTIDEVLAVILNRD